MYVKIAIPDDDLVCKHEIYHVGPEVKYSYLWLHTEEIRKDGGWTEYLKIEGTALGHITVDPEKDKDRGGTSIRWAWWWPERARTGELASNQRDFSIEYVVTTGDMYIMSDEGRTIERVK